MVEHTDETTRALVLLLHDWRFLRLDQVAALLRLERAQAEALLAELVADGIVFHAGNSGTGEQSQAVYTLGRRGADLVASLLGVDRAGLGRQLRRNSVGLLFLEHALRVNDIRLAFDREARSGRGALVTWRYDREITDRVRDPRRPGGHLPVRPDGYLVYQTDGRHVYAFVEADLGTLTNHRWSLRVQAFIAYRLSGAFRNRYGVPSFRVLTVTTTRQRLANLLHTTEKAGGRHLFWFTTWNDLASHSPLSPIWSVAGASVFSSPASTSSPISGK